MLQVEITAHCAQATTVQACTGTLSMLKFWKGNYLGCINEFEGNCMGEELSRILAPSQCHFLFSEFISQNYILSVLLQNPWFSVLHSKAAPEIDTVIIVQVTFT